MAIKPTYSVLKPSTTSVDILNAIRAKASPEYREAIPVATNSTESIRAIGTIIMGYEPYQNAFLSGLYNRIGRVIATSKMYYNPWVGLKKGLLEFGETVEEIFVDIAKAHTFNPDVAAQKFMEREIPDVRAAFHSMNYQKFYKATVSNDQLRQAFLSWQGITDLIAKIVNAMYTGANYDEFMVMKYMLARNILNGYLYPITVPAISTTNINDIVSVLRESSDNLRYMNTKYNYAGVNTFTEKKDQYIITTTKFDAVMDVNSLAVAFNLDKRQLLGNRVQIDSFGAINNERLAMLFADDPSSGYVPLTEAELAALSEIPAILVDKDFFMIFDNEYKFTEDYNGEGLYWQYWYHTWKTFSISSFANADIFVPGVPSVTGVTLSPSTATVAKGGMLALSATVEVENFAPKNVTWTINSQLSSITQAGILTVGAGETASTITVTATSDYDNTKSGTATITVPA